MCEKIEQKLYNGGLSKEDIIKYKYKIMHLKKKNELDSNRKNKFIWIILIIGAVTSVLNYYSSYNASRVDKSEIEVFSSQYLGLFLFIFIGVIGQ